MHTALSKTQHGFTAAWPKRPRTTPQPALSGQNSYWQIVHVVVHTPTIPRFIDQTSAIKKLNAGNFPHKLQKGKTRHVRLQYTEDLDNSLLLTSFTEPVWPGKK